MKAQPENKARRPWRHWYSTADWQRIRRQRLAMEPHCRMCVAEGRQTAATVADHIKPHRGRCELFFDIANTQALCAPHHNREKQQIEVRGYSSKIGADGMPADRNHPFLK